MPILTPHTALPNVRQTVEADGDALVEIKETLSGARFEVSPRGALAVELKSFRGTRVQLHFEVDFNGENAPFSLAVHARDIAWVTTALSMADALLEVHTGSGAIIGSRLTDDGAIMFENLSPGVQYFFRVVAGAEVAAAAHPPLIGRHVPKKKD